MSQKTLFIILVALLAASLALLYFALNNFGRLT